MNTEKTPLTKEQKRTLFLWSALIIGIAVVYLLYTGVTLYRDKLREEKEWDTYLNHTEAEMLPISDDDSSAVSVFVSTYVKSIDAVDIKNSEFSVSFETLFQWDEKKHPDFDMEDRFKIYNGKITEKEKLAEYEQEGVKCQIFHVKADVKKVFSTKRFPLSSYQLRFYIQPKEDMSRIRLHAMEKHYAGAASQLNVSGFQVLRTDISNFYYKLPRPEWYSMPQEPENEMVYSEILTCVELNRSSWGLYLKCIIALLGISVWVFFCMALCVYHKVDSITMIPAVLFGMVSNIMVGANLVPDALETGLLEYINIWGIYTIIMVSVIIAQINQFRKRGQTDRFVHIFSRLMFVELILTVVAGHIIIPSCAYLW